MGANSTLSLSQRHQAIALFEQGRADQSVATTLGVVRGPIGRLYQRWRVHGQGVRREEPRQDTGKPRNEHSDPILGYAYVHTVIDDHSRIAYTEIHDDETAQTATAVLVRAAEWFHQRGITVERPPSDNGGAYRSHLWRDTCAELENKHKRTRPYRPQTNGEIERFHRTLADGWAYARCFRGTPSRCSVPGVKPPKGIPSGASRVVVSKSTPAPALSEKPTEEQRDPVAMSSPYWNPKEPRPGVYPSPSGSWGHGTLPPGPGMPPPGSGWGLPVPAPLGQAMSPTVLPEMAGFGRRLAARTIDYVLTVIAGVTFFLGMAVMTVLLTGNEKSNDAEGTLWALLFLFGWGLLLFFYDWLYLVTWGRTLGKMMLGIKVVSAADGGKLTQGQALGRSAFFGFPQSLPGVGHIFALAESMAALGDQRSRALHDRVAGTLVIRA